MLIRDAMVVDGTGEPLCKAYIAIVVGGEYTAATPGRVIKRGT